MARALQTSRLLHLPQPIMAFSLACRFIPSQSDASRLASDANIQPFKSGRNHPPAPLAAQTRRLVTATNIKNTRSLFVMMERRILQLYSYAVSVAAHCLLGAYGPTHHNLSQDKSHTPKASKSWQHLIFLVLLLF